MYSSGKKYIVRYCTIAVTAHPKSPNARKLTSLKSFNNFQSHNTFDIFFPLLNEKNEVSMKLDPNSEQTELATVTYVTTLLSYSVNEVSHFIPFGYCKTLRIEEFSDPKTERYSPFTLYLIKLLA